MLSNICLHFESTIKPSFRTAFPFETGTKNSMGKTYHFGSAEVVDQIPQEWPMKSVVIGRGTISSWCCLATGLFSELYVFYFPRYKERAAASASFGGTEKFLTNAAFPFVPKAQKGNGGICWRIADINIFVSLCCPSGNVCVLSHFGNVFPGFLFRTGVPYIKEIR